MYDRNKQHTEFGIAPDIAVALADESIAHNKDDIIETARELLSH